MPARMVPFGTDEYYHVFNRGVAYQPVYTSVKDYERFLLCLSYYRFTQPPFKLSRLLQLESGKREDVLENLERERDTLVDVIAFCLMPNHFHLLLQQKKDGGISRYIKHVTDSYTRYFNTKRKRVGPLFQGAFKAVHVETNEQLLHVSRYIHLNPLVSYVVKEADFLSYAWSSLSEYREASQGMITTAPVLQQFRSREAYIQFVLDQAGYGKELEKIKHLRID